jgi:RimJ/RimL family protein N-acetyltransferase
MYEGALVRLRAMRPEDAAAQHRWLRDPDVTRYLAWRYPMSLDALTARLHDRLPPSFADARFSVERLDTGELVGLVALRDATPESRCAELDLVIGERSAWGLGLGTDMTRAACDVAFRVLGLHRVELWVVTGHAAAVRAYEKAGFAHEGVARDKMFKGGRWHDLALMARLA